MDRHFVLPAARHDYNTERNIVTMIYTTEVQHMCPVAKGAYHGPAPIPEEGKWVQAKQIGDISGFTHGIGWCAPQQGACKLTLNVKNGVIEEALVETIGCSGMTHSPSSNTTYRVKNVPISNARMRFFAVISLSNPSLIKILPWYSIAFPPILKRFRPIPRYAQPTPLCVPPMQWRNRSAS